ncbi:MAG: ribulose-phosphate 3-epimerase [Clostridia bacterium]|nr:ribulose-phosphate 3-epimerase [Clostridia bacterium]
MKNKISPSMMCADALNLGSTLKEFEENGIEYLHIDIMDGTFVPNFTLGTDYCKILKNATSIPLDIHLMIEKPEERLDWFPIGENDMVSVHAESTKHLQKVLRAIKDKGAKAFAALNPATPICFLEEVLDDIDGVLIMTVNPGFAGQKLVPQTLDKITRVRKLLDENGKKASEIEVDGNVSFENAEKMKKAGADIFVAGTSSVFKKDLTLTNGIIKLRSFIAD